MCHPSEYSCEHHTHHAPWRASHHHWGCGHGHPGHHPHWGAGHHSGECCCTPGYPHRRFITREEIIAQLEEYLKNLQAEAKGVEEHIAELKKAD